MYFSAHGSGLTSVYIPASVSFIGVNPFSCCSDLRQISVAYDNDDFCVQNDVLFSKDMTKLYSFPTGSSGEYYIPSGVTSILQSAFSGAVGVTSISIPDTVNSIEYFAFSSCKGLTEIFLPDSIETMYGNAFSECDGLIRVKLSNSLTALGPEVFRDCSSLKEIAFPVTISVVGMDAFRNCTSLEDVYYGGTKDQWDSIEYQNGFVQPSPTDGNAPLRNATKHYNSGFYTVSYDANGGFRAPDSQYKIPDRPLTLTDSTPARTDWYFLGWAESPDAVDPDYPRPGGTFTHDANTVLYAVWEQPDLVLPSSVKEIGEESFAGGAFRFVEMPKHAVSIGSRALADCPSLDYIYIYDEVTDIAADTFGNKEKLTIFGVGPYQGVKSAAQVFAEEHGFTFIPLSYRIPIIVGPIGPVIVDP